MAKHAGTGEAMITLDQSPTNQVLITVADNGRGFNPAILEDTERHHPGRFGLLRARTHRSDRRNTESQIFLKAAERRSQLIVPLTAHSRIGCRV